MVQSSQPEGPINAGALRMPAEWEPQAAIWLSWPHNLETWPKNLAQAQFEFIRLAKVIAETQAVNVLCSSGLHAEVQTQCRTALGDVSNLTLVDIPTNDAWARDYAPTFVKKTDGTLAAVDWHYNAWGGKYPPYDCDQNVCGRVAERLEIEVVDPQICLEGGAIEVNGRGVMLSTRSCALDPNRNPEHGLGDVDEILGRHLGTDKHIWLSGNSLEGDDTDGHIDQLARFVDHQTIVYAWTTDKNDSQYFGLEKNLIELRRELVANDLGNISLIPLPIPAPIEYCGRRIPASYCNFLITNELVIVPQFKQLQDQLAINCFKRVFPSREVVGLDSLNLSVGLGSFHCLSQQQPQ